MDIGQERIDGCNVRIELTGAYFDITDIINGDKSLDAEIHAVMQIVSRSRERMVYIADAYSNVMPAQCNVLQCRFDMVSDIQKVKLTADERISIVDDCTDVLSAFLTVAHISQEQTKLTASVNMDVVYRTNQGQISAVRRSISMEGESASGGMRISGARLTDVYLRPDGQFVDGHLALELSCLTCSSVELKKVESVELNEEEKYDTSMFPAVTLVRPDGETLWELAKQYHSSMEKISAANKLDEENPARLLLIPKTI